MDQRYIVYFAISLIALVVHWATIRIITAWGRHERMRRRTKVAKERPEPPR